MEKVADSGFKERIKLFAEVKGLSISGLQAALGLSNSYFSNTTGFTPKPRQRLIEYFPDVNIEWIKTGRGNMFASEGCTVAGEDCCTVPILPVYAAAGSLTEFHCQVSDYECERIISPIKDVSLAMRVTGDSMTPEYPDGSIVLFSKINEEAFIEWGKTFVLDTVNGAIIKKVFPSPSSPDKVLCRSVNPNYADYEVKRMDINGWYVVRMVMASK